MSCIKTVFASGTRDKTIVTAIISAVAVAEVPKFSLPFFPVYVRIFLCSEAAGITGAVLIKVDGFFFAINRGGMFDSGVWSLVGNNA